MSDWIMNPAKGYEWVVSPDRYYHLYHAGETFSLCGLRRNNSLFPEIYREKISVSELKRSFLCFTCVYKSNKE